MIYTKLLSFTILVSIVLCFQTKAEDKLKYGEIPDFDWAIGAPADFREANAVILVDDMFIEVNSTRIQWKRHVRLKVLNKAGIDEIGDRVIRYHGKYDKLKKFDAQTIAPDGTKYKIKKDNIFERKSGEYKEKVFSFSNVEEGSILEYRYTVRSERYRYLAPWYFQNRLYTYKSSVAVQLETGFDYRATFRNVRRSKQKAVITEAKDMRRRHMEAAKLITYSWTLTDLLPLVDEPYMAAVNNYRSTLMFQLLTWRNAHNYITYVDSWEKLGDDMAKINDDFLNKKKEINALAKVIAGEISDPNQQSLALYKYVQNEYKTSSDYNYLFYGHKRIDKLLTEKVGTLEEKNLLLVQMHKALGIQSWQVYISTREHGALNPESPDLRQFDYTLAYVEFEDGWVVLDASNKINPYGVLPPECLVSGAFMIEKGGSSLIRIPEIPKSSVRKDEIRMYVDSEGNVSCSTMCYLTGYLASQYGARSQENEGDDFVESYFVDRLDISYDLGNHSTELSDDQQFVVNVNFESDELVELLDENMVVKPVRYSFLKNPFKSEKRFLPIDFQFPFTILTETMIYFEDSIVNYQFPEELNIEIDGVSLKREIFDVDTCVIIRTIMNMEESIYSPATYGAIKEFFDKVALSANDELIAVRYSEE